LTQPDLSLESLREQNDTLVAQASAVLQEVGALRGQSWLAADRERLREGPKRRQEKTSG
jgi:hypothetical protein